MAKARQALFVVHGMGDHGKNWCDGFTKEIEEIYNGYSFHEFMPFDEQIEVIPVSYNDKFDKLRNQWKTAAQGVLDVLQPLGSNGPSAVAKATQWAAGAGKNDFLRTHVLDVLLYRFVPTVADAVRASVRKQFLEGMDGFERYSVVAHSLGTSVTHDSLVWMFDPQAPNPVKPEQFRFQVVAMVANVSRVLESSENGARWDAYRSVVQPNAKVTKGACNYFLNVWHTWDPVPLPKKFKPMPDWPDKATREIEGAYQDIETEGLEAGGKLGDVHDLGHYLRNPEFHIALFRSLIPIDGLITAKEEKDALDKHRADNPLSKVKQKVEELKKLRLGDEEGDWGEILDMLHKLLK